MERGDMSNNWGNGKCVPQIHPSKRWGITKYGDMAWKWLSTSKVHREIAVSNDSNLNHSWERGLNEHTNGLLRQFFPKQTNFRIVKPEALEKAVMLMNNRLRKSLDYKTPVEVFYADRSDTVALQICIGGFSLAHF